MRISGLRNWRSERRIVPAKSVKMRKQSYANHGTEGIVLSTAHKHVGNIRSHFKSEHQKADMEASPFQYGSLNPNRNEIRLLRVESDSDPKSEIHCRIFHTSLEEAPPYQALSYAWGTWSGSNTVFLNSSYAKVTPNLEHALRQLRSRCADQELNIWVDALCINQDDVSERSLQTSKMRMIYEKAESVTIWLGRKNKLGMSLVRDLNRASPEEVSQMIRDPVQEDRFIALIQLFRKAYWWRVWVIQEVSCAKNATVYCGDDSIPWPEMDNVATILQKHEKDFQYIYYKSPTGIRTLTHGGPRSLRLSRFSSGASAPPLLELLLSHKSKKSTDPRDKVYALVGISATRENFGKIDYSRSLREVFTHTTRHIISNSHKLDVICVRQHDVNEENIPSWVPDWTRPPASVGHVMIGLHNREPSFSAAGISLAQYSFLQDGYVMKATGFVMDRIKAVGSAFRKEIAPIHMLPSLQAVQDWWNVYVGHMGNTASTQVAFSRIISCGNWVFTDDTSYREKLNGIFSLSKRELLRRSPGSLPKQDLQNISFTKKETTQDEKTQVASILSAGLMMNRRRLFISSKNIAGLAPWDSEPGDIVCVLFGCRFPVILRRLGHCWPYHYRLIGEAYVDGYMDGKAMKALDEGVFTPEDFEIH